MRGRRWLALGAALGLAAAAVAARAEVVVLEVEGVAPAAGGASREPRGRDAALRAALSEAVLRVAAELLGEPRPASALPERIRLHPEYFAASYRILEDRGERRAQASSDPAVTREYVVLVEVQVQADSLRRELVAKGLLARAAPGPSRFRVALEELDSYAVYAALRRGLRQAGATRSVPVEIRPGRIVLEVEASDAAERVLERLAGIAAGQGLELRWLGDEAGLLRLGVSPAPPSAPPPAGRP